MAVLYARREDQRRAFKAVALGRERGEAALERFHARYLADFDFAAEVEHLREHFIGDFRAGGGGHAGIVFHLRRGCDLPAEA